ncbi:hypothetical protein [Facilibium subflavum]|uniref:hypothetical protein n=1 Tax=Facilibium subflavum TaxID=2219058 RepID=UPI000E6486BC|nr:hypothetical protein [Facilibium subflavum]
MTYTKKYESFKEKFKQLQPAILIFKGVRYENPFRDFGAAPTKEIPFQSALSGTYEGDFIWDRDKIIVHGGHLGGGSGHPALTQAGSCDCAGRIDEVDGKYQFNFHSGHFKPKADSIIPFLMRFIDASIEGLEGNEKEQKLQALLEMEITVYDDNNISRPLSVQALFDAATVEPSLIPGISSVSFTHPVVMDYNPGIFNQNGNCAQPIAIPGGKYS